MKKENKTNEDFIISEDGYVYAKKERQFEGIWIPKELWLYRGVTSDDKCLLMEIESLSRNEKGCFASNAYLGKFLNKKPQTISIAISKLKELRLIKEIGFDGRKRILKTNRQHIIKIICRLLKKSYSDYDKNNTIDNKYSKTNSNISKDIIYVSGETYKKDSLKKQMGLENNSNKQEISNKQSISNQQITSNKNKQNLPNKKKRRKLSPEDERKIRNDPFTMKVINLWNDFAPVVHTHENPTLPWKDIYDILNQLRKGIFYQRRNWSGGMFDSFCQMNKITSKEIKVALDRPFKKKEIIEVIEQLPSYCKEGNFIKKQGFLSKMPLSSMFYNEYGSFVSMFALAAIKGGAKPISESFEIKCQYPNIAERLKKIDINYDKMTVPDKKQFNKIFSDMDARLKSIPRTSCEHPGIADFITAYYRLMEYFNMQNTLFAFSPYSWQYKKICSYDARPFNQIRQWMLEKKDEDEYERQKEYVRNHGITDDEYCED